ncbi:hypothetical protein [Streptomyces sp. NPDC057426]
MVVADIYTSGVGRRCSASPRADLREQAEAISAGQLYILQVRVAGR